MRCGGGGRVGQSRSRFGCWHTIRSKYKFGLGPPRSLFGSVSLDHGYADLKKR